MRRVEAVHGRPPVQAVAHVPGHAALAGDGDEPGNEAVVAGPVHRRREPYRHRARFAFLDPGAKDFWIDWKRAARRWAAHDVRLHRTGNKLINHPVVGRLELMYDTLELPADPGLTLLVYTAEPDSPTADALTLLASWAATNDLDVPAADLKRV